MTVTLCIFRSKQNCQSIKAERGSLTEILATYFDRMANDTQTYPLMARTISSLVISIFLLVIAADQNDQVDENESLCLWSKPCTVQQHPSRTKLHENASAVTPFLFLVVEKLVMLLLLFSSFFPTHPTPNTSLKQWE